MIVEQVPSPTLAPALLPTRAAGRPVGSRSSYRATVEHQARVVADVKGTLAIDPILRPAECCALLQISYSTLRKRIASGEILASRTAKKHGHLRIRFSSLRKFLADSTVPHE